VDLHHGPKATGGHGAAEGGFELADEALVERDRGGGTRGVVEGRARAFARAGDERELAHNEGAAVGVADGEIHLAVGVLKNAERGDFLGKPFSVVRRVAGGDTEQDEEAAVDGADGLAVDDDTGGGDALNDRFHGNLKNPRRQISKK